MIVQKGVSGIKYFYCVESVYSHVGEIIKTVMSNLEGLLIAENFKNFYV